MKKILLGLLLSLLATPLIAQFDSQTAQSTSMGWSEGRSIVRDVDSLWAVGYINSSGICQFYATRINGFDIPGSSSLSSGKYVQFVYNNTFIKDIQYASGRVFFCGTMPDPTTSTPMALYGWFELTDLLYATSVAFNFYYFHELDTLSRMAIVDPNGTSPHIIAVGSKGMDCAVADIYHDVNIEYSFLPTVAGVPEKINDVLLSDDKVVFIGTNKLLSDIGSPICFHIRQAQATGLFSSTLQKRYLFLNSAGNIFQQYGIASTTMPEGRVAIAHQGNYNSTENRLAIIQLNSSPSCERVISIPYANRGLIYEATYLPDYKSVIALYKDGFYMHHPYASMPCSSIQLTPNMPYSSVVLHSGQSILSAGEDRWLLQRFLPSSVSASCMDMQAMIEQQLINYNVIEEPTPLTVQTIPSTNISLTNYTLLMWITPTCTY